MSYATQKLRDISVIKTGKLDSNAAVENGTYPFFTCDPQTLRINKWAYDTEAVLLAGNNASGNYTAKYYRGKFNAYQRTYIIEAADSERLSVRFLCYAINQQLRLLKAMSSGSTTKFLTIRMLHNLDIPCPEIELQDRIVNVLGTIDDLIENNQKQIKLLEETARRLYKEWFVNFRFPGYEDTPIVDGVPEGWADGALGDIAVFKRGKTITKAQVSDGNIPVVAGGLEPAYYHNKANTTAPLITVSASGANAGFTRLYNIDVFASDCSYIDSNSTPFLLFVYCFLKTNAMKLNSLQKGSAQPHVYAKDLNAMVLSVPSEGVLFRQMIKTAGTLEKMPFIQDNEPGVLITEYYLFYLERCEIFSKSHHIFDEEPTVEKKLSNIQLYEDGKLVNNWQFVKSHENIYIQVSDMIAGLLRRLFMFLDDNSIEQTHSISLSF